MKRMDYNEAKAEAEKPVRRLFIVQMRHDGSVDWFSAEE